MNIFGKCRSLARYLEWLALATLATGGLVNLQANSTNAATPPAASATKAARPDASRTPAPVANVALRTAAPPPDVRPATLATSHLRDPFRAPEEVKSAVSATVDPRSAKPRPPGIRGLPLDQLRLQGVVREDASHRMLALVAGQSNLSYFVHEGDQLYNGQVIRITADAVYIRRTDSAPVRGSREIALRLGPGAGGQP
jgi:Tfp pilus assembly protein PilP